MNDLKAIKWPLDTVNFDAFAFYVCDVLDQRERAIITAKVADDLREWNSKPDAYPEVQLIQPAAERFITIASSLPSQPATPVEETSYLSELVEEFRIQFDLLHGHYIRAKRRMQRKFTQKTKSDPQPEN